MVNSTASLPARESRFIRLLYNHHSGTVIAQFERDSETATTRSLYMRDRRVASYEQLPAPDERTSYESPVVGRSVPLMFFNVMTANTRGGRNWSHVARADVLTRVTEVLFSRDELVPIAKSSPEWVLQPWVSELIDVSDDGMTLTCKVGIPEPQPGGAFHMKYGLFELNTETRALTHLADFENPYW